MHKYLNFIGREHFEQICGEPPIIPKETFINLFIILSHSNNWNCLGECSEILEQVFPEFGQKFYNLRKRQVLISPPS